MKKEKIKILKKKYAGSFIGKKRMVKMKEKSELELLKEFKKSSGWSYQKLAHHLGVHYQTVIFWILGKRYPSPLALERIQKFLKSTEKSGIPGDLKR